MIVDRIFSNKYLLRNVEAEDLLESFLVSAVAALLGYRFLLKLTGYPMLGGETLHIAHVLLGGAFMLIAMIILLVFISQPATRLAAVLGGIGFGLFIDEVGKFITHDNNYFFEPSIAIIYVIFVLLYLLSQSINTHRMSQREYLLNSINIAHNAVYNDLDGYEKKRALQLLSECDSKDRMVRSVKSMISRIDHIKKKSPNPFIRSERFLRKLYHWLISKKWFSKAMIAFFVIQAITSLAQSATDLNISQLTPMEVGGLVASSLSGLFILAGLWQIKTSRVQAYIMFKRAVLASIFLTQFFRFYKEQFAALTGLVWNIAILIILRYMIEEELKIRKK